MKLVPYIRQSNSREKRGGGRAISIEEQRRDIQRWAAANGVALDAEVVERSVSGSKPWQERALGNVIDRCARGEVGGVVVAWQDRLSRESSKATAEVWEALDKLGLRLVCVGDGIDTDTGDHEMLFAIKAAISRDSWKRYRANWDKAKSNAIARGIPPWPNAPVGYRRREDGTLEPDPATAKIIVGAFRERAFGATIKEVRAYLAERGVPLSWHGTAAVLESRAYIGELHFGSYEPNLAAWEGIVPRHVFDAVQARKQAPRGARPRSERLLARVGVLRCGTCGSRMVVGTTRGGGKSEHTYYRCPPTCDCTRRVTISAPKVEALVVHAVRCALRDAEGRAEGDRGMREAIKALDSAETRYTNAVESTLGLDSSVVGPKLRALQEERDAAREQLNGHRRTSDAFRITAGAAWDELSDTARRELIAAVIDRVIVKPGKTDERVEVVMRENFDAASLRPMLDREAEEIDAAIEEIEAGETFALPARVA